MRPDYYATLGVAPTSEDVVIRAAYLALMRRYHPDKNASVEAAARVRAITAAYAVLGDWERRSEYDYARAAETPAIPARRRRRTSPTAVFAATAALVLLLVVAVPPFIPTGVEPDRLASRPSLAAAAPRADPTAQEVPTVEPASALPGEDAIVAPLSGVAQIDERTKSPPDGPAASAEQPQERAAALAESAPAPPPAAAAQRPRAAPTAAAPMARPSFSCRFAKGRGQTAVCNDGNLAALDRNRALLYSQSVGRADAAKQALLVGSHDEFVTRRDSCRSSSCVRTVYVDSMREISEIMALN